MDVNRARTGAKSVALELDWVFLRVVFSTVNKSICLYRSLIFVASCSVMSTLYYCRSCRNQL
jgi:hypothetical protein